MSISWTYQSKMVFIFYTLHGTTCANLFIPGLIIEEHKVALFNITPSVLVSLHPYQITFANDTDSNIVEDEQNSQTTKFFTHFGRNQDNILDVLLMFWKMVGVIQKNGMVTLLFQCFTTVNFLYWILWIKIIENKPILSDSLFIKTW